MIAAKLNISSIGTGYGRCGVGGDLEVARYHLGNFIWEKTNAKLNHAGDVFISPGMKLFDAPSFLRFSKNISGLIYDVDFYFRGKLKVTIISTGKNSIVDISRGCVIGIGVDGLPFNLVKCESSEKD